ncbi:MAG: hypothetical protein BWY32_00980 [bacterium ADurb.Bin243]|nr:MAG: hypothetical protein BWY32_00980 [bacterium ADurb.Bin243]
MAGSENNEANISRNGSGSNGYKSGYYLQLSEELFKYSFFLLFIVFGAIYYYNFVFLHKPTLLKTAGLYFIVYIIFGIFYILLPLKRMLFSNLQIYADKENLNLKHGAFAARAALEALKKIGVEVSGDARRLEGDIFITYKSDYYVAFPPFFLSLSISMIIFALYVSCGAAAADSGFINAAALSYFALNCLMIVLGFRHFINRPYSTHFGFQSLFLILNSVYSIFICLYFPALFDCRLLIAALDSFLIICFLYAVFYIKDLTAFIRLSDRNIYSVEFNGRNYSAGEAKKLEFNYFCRFVQTPYAIGFIVYDKDGGAEDGTPFYCDTSKESVEIILEVFKDRIVKNADLDASSNKNCAVDYFCPLTVADLSKKYGRSQFLVLLAVNIISALVFYEIFKPLLTGK